MTHPARGRSDAVMMSVMEGLWRQPPWRWLLVLLGVGLAGRLALAFTTLGQPFDIDAYARVRDALARSPLHLYALVNGDGSQHWPYPGGFVPWVALSGWLSDHVGLRFDGWIQVAPIAADIGLAVIVFTYLGSRGASGPRRLAAAALVVAGPGFWVISGYHGQIDAVAILPAVLGLWFWDRSESRHRALVAGALIGLAASIKAPPLLTALALLPTARSLREAATLLGTTVAVVVGSVAPFLIADWHSTVDGLTENRGLPGFGGISLLVQPDLSALWLHTRRVELSPVSQALFDHGTIFVIAALLATGFVLIRRRVEPLPAAVVIWLAYFSLGINFGITYLILGVPFFLMAGRVREVAALQMALVVPLALLYIQRGRSLPLEWIYTPVMLVVWVGILACLVVSLRRIVGTPDHGRSLIADAHAVS